MDLVVRVSDLSTMSDILRSQDAAHHGITPRQLRGPGWELVTRGVHRRKESPKNLLANCRAMLHVLPPGSAFCHLTAAALHGLWLPQLPEWMPILASLPPGVDRPERARMYVFRSRAGERSPNLVAGVPVLAPELVLGQLAEDLAVIDLVAAIDSALARGLCDLPAIEFAMRSRQRGLPVLRRALALADGRSESPWETRLRLIHQTAGLSVEPQFLVRDDSGSVVARADLRLTRTRRLPEYDGAPHRDRAQHEYDLEHDKLLARLGYERYGYIARELVHAPGQIIRDAEDALDTKPDPWRLTSWLDLAGPSVLTRDGKMRLLRRLHRFARPLRGHTA